MRIKTKPLATGSQIQSNLGRKRTLITITLNLTWFANKLTRNLPQYNLSGNYSRILRTELNLQDSATC